MPNYRDAISINGIKVIDTDGKLTVPKVGVLTGVSLAADVTLTAVQAQNSIIEVTTGHASNAIIAPTVLGAMYWIVNNHATLKASIKTAGGTAVEVAATKKALVYCNGTEYIRLLADQ